VAPIKAANTAIPMTISLFFNLNEQPLF
jgi:hypothetical protein